MKYVHHYTSISNLALILSSGKIRFNRLDLVDDISESAAVAFPALARQVFVTCWTEVAEESIPLWHMYSSEMRGVCITFPEDMFHWRPFDKPPGVTFEVHGTSDYPLSGREFFLKDGILLIGSVNSREEFGRRVNYCADSACEYRKITQITPSGGVGSFDLNTNVKLLAYYKNEAWHFQSEYRYSLIFFPAPLTSTEFGDYGRINERMMELFATNADHGRHCFDVQLAPSAFENLTITLGPRANDGDFLLVKSLLGQFAKNAHISWSALRGTVR